MHGYGPLFLFIFILIVLPELLHIAFGAVIKFFVLYFAVVAVIGIFVVGCLLADETGAMVYKTFGPAVADGLFATTMVAGALLLAFLWVDTYLDFKYTTAVFRKLRGIM